MSAGSLLMFFLVLFPASDDRVESIRAPAAEVRTVPEQHEFAE